MGLTSVPLSHSHSTLYQHWLTHSHIEHTQTLNTCCCFFPPLMFPFLFLSLQIHTSRCAGRGRMWGKPKTELCLSLTQRYSKHLYPSEDRLHVYVCNSFPVSSFSPFPGVQLHQMYFTPALLLSKWQIAHSSVVHFGSNPARYSHLELGLQCVRVGFIVMATQDFTYLVAL